MTERKGKISVQTADIFPIIKKWLYSEHDIFLRELVANATDAITKRATNARLSGAETPTGRINVDINKTDKTITISDNGIGMNEEEVIQYLAHLAFSGAEDFIKKMKDAGAEASGDIIGKFGLGFYSAFMVSEKVEVETLSMAEGAKPVKWICEGNPEYTFADSAKKEVGTSITLHINEESKEFLDEFKVSETLRKFCDFMPHEIGVVDVEKRVKPTKEDGSIDESAPETPASHTIINSTRPLWKRDPKELKDEDYIEFYRKLFPMDGEPLFWIHLKVDHPFTLEGILFFPKINPNKPFNDSNIKLYSKQVFVSDSVKNIIPEFLSLLKGAIDSSDIPLNVSRSSLQGDPNIRRISNYITKKVAESLKILFKKDRPKFEKIWKDISLFVKYGIISEPKFDELMRERVLFSNSEDKLVTLSEYRESIPESYKEKLGDKVVYFEKFKSDFSLRSQLKEAGVHTIETEDHIDPHFMQHVESKEQNETKYQFVSVDSEIHNILESENATEDDVKIKELFETILYPKQESEKEKSPLEGGNDIEISKLKNATAPAYFKVDEQMKRFAQMAQSMGQNSTFPVKKTLVINPANPLIQNALKIHQKGNEQLVGKIAKHVEDLATISSQGLDVAEKDHFIKRTQNLMEELTNLAL